MRRRRLLCYGHASFPDPAQAFSYEFVRDLGDRLDAEVRFAHYEKSDPRLDGGFQLKWVPSGLLVPMMPHPMRSAFDHFSRTRPQRMQSLLRHLEEQHGLEVDDIMENPQLLAAFSHARWAEAWAPDLLVSFFGHHGAVTGFVTMWLLGLPLVHFHYPQEDIADRIDRLQPEVIRFSNLICVPDDEQRLELRREFDGSLDQQIVSQQDPQWQIELAEKAEDLLRQRSPAASRLDLGPRAAFTTIVSPRRARAAAKTQFVIVGAERTGSNLLVDMLATHPAIAAAGELFNTSMVDEDVLDSRSIEGLDPSILLPLRRENPGAFLDAMAAHALRAGRSRFGFKLLYYHMLAYNRVVDHLVSLPDLCVIHLVRRDRVARYVSHITAESTGQWWGHPSDLEAQRRGGRAVELDPRMLLWDMQFVKQLEDRARATFAGLRGVEIAYEDLVADREGVTAQLLDLLGVERMTLVPPTVKQSEGDPRARIVNYDLLWHVFRGSPWAHLIPPRAAGATC